MKWIGRKFRMDPPPQYFFTQGIIINVQKMLPWGLPLAEI